MQFTSDGVLYKGFRRWPVNGGDTRYAAVLVVAWMEGEPELWQVEHSFGRAQLARYYAERLPCIPVRFETFFKRF